MSEKMRAALFALCVAACAPREAYWAPGECLANHTELVLIPVTTMVGRTVVTRFQPIPRSVCDRRGPPICRAGRDGVADCSPQVEAEKGSDSD
jgi:hypothetical protein